jgi:hypothetical protein
VNFEEGNEVWLNIKKFRLPEGLNQKISYASPFNVLKKKIFNTYKIKLPENLKVHPIFHVSLLKLVAHDASRPNREYNSSKASI